MLIQALVFNILWQLDFNLYEWLKNNSENNYLVNHFLGVLFYFSLINIFIIGLSGVMMLVRKCFVVGFLALTATFTYVAYFFQISAGF